MLMQVTETRTRTFDARVLSARDAVAVTALAGQPDLPGVPDLKGALEMDQILGDFAGLPGLQAGTALLPLYGQTPLALSLRAAGFGADGQGAVLTPICTVPDYGEVRHFLRVALTWAQGQYASYHIWAVLPLLPGEPAACEELCAQYLATGLSLRGLCPVAGGQMLLVFALRPLPRWEEPIKRVHLTDAALPRLLECGYAAADFGWDQMGLVLMLRPTAY